MNRFCHCLAYSVIGLMTLSIALTIKMSSATTKKEMRQVRDSRIQGGIELLVILEWKKGL